MARSWKETNSLTFAKISRQTPSSIDEETTSNDEFFSMTVIHNFPQAWYEEEKEEFPLDPGGFCNDGVFKCLFIFYQFYFILLRFISFSTIFQPGFPFNSPDFPVTSLYNFQLWFPYMISLYDPFCLLYGFPYDFPIRYLLE